jgi:hypothetical protein
MQRHGHAWRAFRHAAAASLHRGIEAGQTAGHSTWRTRLACYNPVPRMLGRDWALLVSGTLLGVLSLTADLLGIGAFPGFGWKQVLGTAVALAVVLYSSWRIFQGSQRDRP